MVVNETKFIGVLVTNLAFGNNEWFYLTVIKCECTH